MIVFKLLSLTLTVSCSSSALFAQITDSLFASTSYWSQKLNSRFVELYYLNTHIHQFKKRISTSSDSHQDLYKLTIMSLVDSVCDTWVELQFQSVIESLFIYVNLRMTYVDDILANQTHIDIRVFEINNWVRSLNQQHWRIDQVVVVFTSTTWDVYVAVSQTQKTFDQWFLSNHAKLSLEISID